MQNFNIYGENPAALDTYQFDIIEGVVEVLERSQSIENSLHSYPPEILDSVVEVLESSEKKNLNSKVTFVNAIKDVLEGLGKLLKPLAKDDYKELNRSLKEEWKLLSRRQYFHKHTSFQGTTHDDNVIEELSGIANKLHDIVESSTQYSPEQINQIFTDTINQIACLSDTVVAKILLWVIGNILWDLLKTSVSKIYTKSFSSKATH